MSERDPEDVLGWAKRYEFDKKNKSDPIEELRQQLLMPWDHSKWRKINDKTRAYDFMEGFTLHATETPGIPEEKQRELYRVPGQPDLSIHPGWTNYETHFHLFAPYIKIGDYPDHPKLGSYLLNTAMSLPDFETARNIHNLWGEEMLKSTLCEVLHGDISKGKKFANWIKSLGISPEQANQSWDDIDTKLRNATDVVDRKSNNKTRVQWYNCIQGLADWEDPKW